MATILLYPISYFTRKKLVFVFLLVFSFLTSLGQDPREIINRYLDTVSFHNVEKWHNVKSLYTETVVFDSGDGLSILDTDPIYGKLFRQWPDKTKEELYSDSTFTKLTSEFLFLKTGHTILVGNLHFFTDVNKSLWFEFFPERIQIWLANSENVTYQGMKQLPHESVFCHEVEITTDEIKRTLYFNIDTYLLEALFVPEGNYLLRILDYKLIDGYLFPTKEVGIRESQMISLKKYNKVIFNQKLPEKIFDKLKSD